MSEQGYSILTMPLLTEPWQEHILETRFSIVEHLKNQLIAMELRKLKNLERTKAYRAVCAEIEAAPKEKRSSLYAARSKVLQKAGFSEIAFKNDMAGKHSDMQKHFSEHIAAQITHKAASDVWRAFEQYLFHSGRSVHFHKRGTLDSVACQTAGNGMRYENGVFVWTGGRSPNQIKLTVPVMPARNEYEREMMKKPVKNMRVVRKWMKSRYKYYLQLTLADVPAEKGRIIGHGRVGIDIGTQTVAIATEHNAMLLELADRIDRNHRKKLELQRMMDRSRRYSNPDNYNPDGTIRRGGGKRMNWSYSHHYRVMAGKVRELERKNAAIRKYQHTCLANEILALGDNIFVEQMLFSGLQHRAKETKTDEKGRFLKKKRFGKSLANKAPAMFVSILQMKAEQAGAQFHKVDTKKYKASQLDHTSGEYLPSHLSKRMKHLSNGDVIQRDLYSAFLLMNSADDLCHPDSTLCDSSYPLFKTFHDSELARIEASGAKHPSSFGF